MFAKVSSVLLSWRKAEKKKPFFFFAIIIHFHSTIFKAPPYLLKDLILTPIKVNIVNIIVAIQLIFKRNFFKI